MHNIRRELSIRKAEIEELMKFAQYIENGQFFSHATEDGFTLDSILVRTDIKASVILVLYNIIESTMTKSLIKIHEVLKNEHLKYADLNPELKKIIMVYYGNAISKSSDMHNASDFLIKLFAYVNEEENFSISYDELSKYYQLYSGNLDAKAISTVLKKYGIDFSKKASELQTIKNNRNKLAHGELSFEEVGRNLSVPQLNVMMDRTFEYLSDVITKVEEFINSRGYLNLPT